MRSAHEVAIVGGGPAGLAVAIHAATRGLSAVVLERSHGPPDKTCGEGLMPSGARSLEAMGVALGPEDATPFRGIRYVQEDGTAVLGTFRDGWGLGVRRPALVRAMAERARELGVEVRSGTSVVDARAEGSRVLVATDAGDVEARIVVAADGLASPLRRAAGLEGPRAPGRFGLRQHFAVAPWSDLVEVHWAEGVEAYVTPTGTGRVNVAFLWDPAALVARAEGRTAFRSLLARFPALEAKLAGAREESAARGLGPLVRTSTRRVAGRLVLVGDAAGFLDGITGEGTAIAFHCAAELGRLLPKALARGPEALLPYERTYARAWRRYQWLTRGLLAISRRPRLRRRALRLLATFPPLFEHALAIASGGHRQPAGDRAAAGLRRPGPPGGHAIGSPGARVGCQTPGNLVPIAGSR